MSKETTKRLKDAHDTIGKHLRERKAAKKTVTPKELAALLSAEMRFGAYEADYTELYDTGRLDPLEKAGTPKIRKDIIHAGMSPDHIAEHKKFSNTTGEVKQYMTKYYPSECDAPFFLDGAADLGRLLFFLELSPFPWIPPNVSRNESSSFCS